ncbi:MAG TPA: hypothetical protein VMZ28_21135 [Kofleriaceae bacterium]|nr:hypothetical protein [Kofleriaceae bacterium]
MTMKKRTLRTIQPDRLRQVAGAGGANTWVTYTYGASGFVQSTGNGATSPVG